MKRLKDNRKTFKLPGYADYMEKMVFAVFLVWGLVSIVLFYNHMEVTGKNLYEEFILSEGYMKKELYFPSYTEIMGNRLFVFPAGAVVMAVLFTMTRYQYISGKDKSIYQIRMMPVKNFCFKICAGPPLLYSLILLLAGAVTFVITLMIYYQMIPDFCMAGSFFRRG